MACQAAPVARAFSDQALALPGTTYLGIVGDQAHNNRCSGHNCAKQNCTDRGTFTPGYAHASDTGVPNRETAQLILDAALHGPAQNTVLYAIYDGTGYYPDWRGGGTFPASGHESHVHVSHAPGTTFLRPDFGIGAPRDPTGWAAVLEFLRRLFSFIANQSTGPEVLEVIIAKRVQSGGGYWMLGQTETGPVRSAIPNDRVRTVVANYEAAGGKVADIDSQGLALYRDVTAEAKAAHDRDDIYP